MLTVTETSTRPSASQSASSSPADRDRAPTAPASETAESAPAKPPSAPIWLRIVQGLSGLGLMVGFFMPWIRLGEMVSVSGFGLVLTSGDVVEQLSAPSRGLIVAIPLIGLALIAIAMKGFRGLAWAGLATGILIILVGLYTLISFFLDSTGTGMWLVTGSALLALGTSAIALRLSRAR